LSSAVPSAAFPHVNAPRRQQFGRVIARANVISAFTARSARNCAAFTPAPPVAAAAGLVWTRAGAGFGIPNQEIRRTAEGHADCGIRTPFHP
jgi:hypothetical protein